jgi:hypothetical protein
MMTCVTTCATGAVSRLKWRSRSAARCVKSNRAKTATTLPTILRYLGNASFTFAGCLIPTGDRGSRSYRGDARSSRGRAETNRVAAWRV